MGKLDNAIGEKIVTIQYPDDSTVIMWLSNGSKIEIVAGMEDNDIDCGIE